MSKGLLLFGTIVLVFPAVSLGNVAIAAAAFALPLAALLMGGRQR